MLPIIKYIWNGSWEKKLQEKWIYSIKLHVFINKNMSLWFFYLLAKSCSKFSKPGFNNMLPELPDVQPGFRKIRGIRDQIASIHWISKKAREFQKNIYFCFIDYANTFDCVNRNNLWGLSITSINLTPPISYSFLSFSQSMSEPCFVLFFLPRLLK